MVGKRPVLFEPEVQCISKGKEHKKYEFGKKEINGTKIVIPDVPGKSDDRHQGLKKHKLFRKRAGIEPSTGHLKSDCHPTRNFYKGVAGDAVNVLPAAAAYNFKRGMKALWHMLQKNRVRGKY